MDANTNLTAEQIVEDLEKEAFESSRTKNESSEEMSTSTLSNDNLFQEITQDEHVLIGADSEDAFRRQESNSSIRTNPDAKKTQTLSSIYSSRQNKSANTKEKQELYGSQWDNVRLTGDTDGLEIDAQKRKAEYLKLSHSMRAGQILNGEIIGAIRDDAFGPTAVVSLVSEDGSYAESFFQIKIFSNRLFDFDEKMLTTADGISTVMNELNHRIGGRVSFIIKYVNEVDGTAWGCRINAMDIYGKQNFIDLRKTDNMPLLFAGIKTNATVLSIHREDLVCEVGGIECQIPKEELSWTPLRELNREFYVGQKFMVKILNVEQYTTKKGNDTFRNMIRLDASKKQAEINPNKRYFNTIALDATYRAEVKYITQNVIHVLVANKIGCVCPVPSFPAGANGQLPARGQECLVRITNKEIQEGQDGQPYYRIAARIIRYSSNS